ncbi:MAG: DUF3006 family protein [Lachnospiraceae bacterium]|nr:DUF3006 family protein [Lachnospiraceae bacterium]
MKLTILRIEEEIVTCELEDGTLLDIAKRWITEPIEVGTVLEFNIETAKK